MKGPAMPQSRIRHAGIALALILTLLAGAMSARGAAADDTVVVEGPIAAIASSISGVAGQPPASPSVSLLLGLEDGPVTVELAPGAEILDAAGTVQPVRALDLRQQVRVYGAWHGDSRVLAHRIEVIEG